MKMYKLEVYVLDFEDYGLENAIITLDQNDDIHAMVLKAEEADIGEWSDDHECNDGGTPIERFRSYFKK